MLYFKSWESSLSWLKFSKYIVQYAFLSKSEEHLKHKDEQRIFYNISSTGM